jgi:hypothetical protein
MNYIGNYRHVLQIRFQDQMVYLGLFVYLNNTVSMVSGVSVQVSGFDD